MIHPLPQKPFYFIRHGESEWNALDQFAGGQIDTPLTPLGRQQAMDASGIFDALTPFPTHIIHSSLSRARDTAAILNKKHHLPMIEDPELREIDAGDWAGKPNAEAKAMWDDGLTPPNGENLDVFAHRIMMALSRILSNQSYAVPFIAAHGRIINAIDHLYGIPPRSLQLGNCQILKFIPLNDLSYPWIVCRHQLVAGKIIEEHTGW